MPRVLSLSLYFRRNIDLPLYIVSIYASYFYTTLYRCSNNVNAKSVSLNNLVLLFKLDE